MASRKSSALWAGLDDGDLVVVDTAPLIYILEDHPTFAPLFDGLFEAAESGRLQIAVSTISLAEVLVGPLKQGLDALAKRYERALGSFDLMPVTAEISVTAARLRASTGLRLPDALLAATALEIGAVALVTHDRDFSKLSGLKVLTGERRPT
ncbi:PIN domain-containing protein [Ramlibacter sp. WS9]|uniref:type II toxin-antitoxin system VapC family toxin n=1 Tax=Ramlibacter sp. WS9 TaxID=1882741 RepID=UPI00114167D7|nr:PIN domain-containing protein [Ramlibacter sp. WS9]ROZ76471.1 type II toxin-antitoxin system VapC family toxin [Ramlibacter sp. WS9]